MIGQTRTLTFDLHPCRSGSLGLVPRHWYAEQFGRRTSVEVEVAENGSRQGLPSSVANYLFRAIKELVSNGTRHGKAKQGADEVHWSPTGLQIVVDDVMIALIQRLFLLLKPVEGLGLAGIHERLPSFGGHMRIESQTGQGTRVVLEIPEWQLPGRSKMSSQNSAG